MDKQPSSEFLEILDLLTTPLPPPSATIRVAEFHYGKESLAAAIERAGFSVVATLDGKRQLPDFDTMPPFDIVIADCTDDPKEREGVVDYVMRFLRVRKPPAFLVLGGADDLMQVAFVGASRPLGYEVSGEGGFIAGTSERGEKEAIKKMLKRVVREVAGEN